MFFLGHNKIKNNKNKVMKKFNPDLKTNTNMDMFALVVVGLLILSLVGVVFLMPGPGPGPDGDGGVDGGGVTQRDRKERSRNMETYIDYVDYVNVNNANNNNNVPIPNLLVDSEISGNVGPQTSLLLDTLPWIPEFTRGTVKVPGQFLIRDPTTNIRLYLETDGNMCLYAGPVKKVKPTWCTNTQNQGVTHATLQDDGDLVIYAGEAKLWSTGTNVYMGSTRGERVVPVGGLGMRSGIRILNALGDVIWQSD
jgi:hypothetical protein